MALLVRFNSYFKYLFTVPCLALNINAPAFSIRSILYFLFMPAVRTFYFFDCSPPAILLNISCIDTRKSSTFCSLRSDAIFFCHSLLIARISGVYCFNTFSSSSVRIRIILPSGVSGSSPAKRSVNSSQDMSLASRLSLIPYWLLKLDTIRPKSSIMS